MGFEVQNTHFVALNNGFQTLVTVAKLSATETKREIMSIVMSFHEAKFNHFKGLILGLCLCYSYC